MPVLILQSVLISVVITDQRLHSRGEKSRHHCPSSPRFLYPYLFKEEWDVLSARSLGSTERYLDIEGERRSWEEVWDKIDGLKWEEQAWVQHRSHKGSSEIEKLLLRCRNLDIKGKKWKVDDCWIWSKPERIYPKKASPEGRRWRAR